MNAALSDYVFVFELGTEVGAPHLHYWLKSAKSKATLVRLVKAAFKLPEDRGQRYSMKATDLSKVERYFVYLAKGVTGKRGDKVFCVAESAPRMWPILHDQFHNRAEPEGEPGARGVRGVEAWYAEWAAKLQTEGKTSREDVMEAVTKYYVYESKKGFDRFLVTRTFWRMWSLVNAADAHTVLLQQCLDAVRG